VVLDLKGGGLHQQAKVFFNKTGEKNILLEFDVLEVL
jgi:hypothetical protein